ncbi:Ppx/GppA family phosphatase [Alkalicoccus daliensis]|uniref:Exopolyphosphatase / guanosine-5'-triphosphate,3'-diphosphate pyrophosphatase n=1 Tax=Alkalicoccus daliensis TaxID=745820 RepID=A0A1H0BAG9_9BACI|nr:Ppx/GppA family phosphatase [Alkalicoccus daliensis]SDN42629.1 exopolyphosphatase / guanosine-5'-triphosphate,3'-diphosphate pyrophosphatase [Alkalicoccus daliensis]
MTIQQIGIIDMGSNSVRFVIYEVDEQACFREIQNLKITARLSTYIDDEGFMNKEGISLVLDTLDKFASIAESYQLTAVRGVATAAIRNASNRDEIMEAIRTESEFPFEVLTEEQEAYYGYLAVTNSTDFDEAVTIDIGGGSTEITYFKNRELQQSFSFPFGAITLKKQFISGDTPNDDEWEKLCEFIKHSYHTLDWIADKNVPVIGIGGSARNLALVHQDDISYPLSGLHQYTMTLDDISNTAEDLLDMSMKKREKLDGLSKDRADIILPAIAAMQVLLEEVGTEQFVVSNRGLRDGLFFEKMLASIEVTHFPNVKEESFYQLSNYYRLNAQHQKRISVLSTYLANELGRHDLINLTAEQSHLLRLGANVFYIGRSIHAESESEHTFYLLTNQSIDGLSHMDRLAVAFISSFKSKSQLKQFAKPFKKWVEKDTLQTYELLGALNRFCHALNISEQSVINKLEITKVSKRGITFEIYYSGDCFFEEEQANKYKKHLERPLNRSIDLKFIEDK